MTSPALVILDPFSSGNAYEDAARRAGLIPVVVNTYSPPPDAPIHAFLPSSSTYTEVFRLPLDHSAVLQGDERALVDQTRLLDSGLGEELRTRGLVPRGVVAGSELSVMFADALAAQWNLPGNDVHKALSCRHKGRMKERAWGHGVGCAHHEYVRSPKDVDVFVRSHYSPTSEHPMFLKPPWGGGSTRVRKCRSVDEIHRNLGEVASQPDFFGFRAGFALLETELPGIEYAVNLFGDGDSILVTDIWRYDRRDIQAALPFGTNVYRNVLTVRESEGIYSQLGDAAIRIARAFGRRLGPMHLELKEMNGKISLIELGARLAGGGMPQVLHRETRWDPTDASVAVACGRAPASPLLAGIANTAAIVCCSIAKGGYVKEVRGLDRINKSLIPSFVDFLSNRVPKPGQYVRPTEDTSTCPLIVYLSHSDARRVEEDAEQVHALFQVFVE